MKMTTTKPYIVILTLISAIFLPGVPAQAVDWIGVGETRTYTDRYDRWEGSLHVYPIDVWVDNKGTVNSSGRNEVRVSDWNCLWGDCAGVYNNTGAVWNNYGTLDFWNRNEWSTGDWGKAWLQNSGIFNNKSGATLVIQGASRLENISGGKLYNSGTIENKFKFINNSGATLDNMSGGTLNNDGTLFTNNSGSTLNNAGTLNNFWARTLYNSGLLTSTGRLTNAGTLTNDGVLTLAKDSSYDFTNGRLNNNGTLVLNRDFNIGAANGGTVNLNAGSTLNNTATLTLINANSINYGVLNNYGLLENLNGNTLASVTNMNTLNNHRGGTLDNLKELRNTGTLNNSGTLNNYNVLWNYGGTLNNQAGGTLNNSYSQLRNFSGGTVNNAGILNNRRDIFNDSGATLNNTGTLINTNTKYGRLFNRGTLNNSGMLTLDSDSFYDFSGGTLHNNSGGILELYRNFTFGEAKAGTVNLNPGGALHNYATLANLSGYTLRNSGALGNSGTFNNAGVLNNSGALGNSGTLRNSGTLTNLGAITGSGTYTQTAGETSNNGTLTQAAIAINGGRLSGTGTINGRVSLGSGAILAPGNSPGTMTINGPFSSSGELLFEISGLGAGEYDSLHLNGNTTFAGGKIAFDFINGYHAAAGNHWGFLFSNAITGWDTLNFAVNGLDNGLVWEFQDISGGKELWIKDIPAPVPLPAALWLLGSGLLGLAAIRRKSGN